MGFFFKALAAIVTADAIDRHARSRPTKYWYPNQSQLPRAGNQAPRAPAAGAPAAGESPLHSWDPEHPERPS